MDDETHRRARLKAAALGTSVSSLVRRFLTDLATGESKTERLRRLERTSRGRITRFRAGDRLGRDEAHHRDA